MELNDLLRDVPVREKWGDLSVPVTSLHYDSRAVCPGAMFIALPGLKVDGHRFIPRALEDGAAAILAQRAPETVPTDRAWIRVDDTREAMGPIAAAFHGHWTRGNENAELRFILSDKPELSLARLSLVRAVAVVVASGLAVMGVIPVEEMR